MELESIHQTPKQLKNNPGPDIMNMFDTFCLEVGHFKLDLKCQ